MAAVLILDLKRRIAEKVQRLQEATGDSKRTRKRIKQSLGKLNKQLAELESGAAVDPGAVAGDKQTAAAAAKKQATRILVESRDIGVNINALILRNLFVKYGKVRYVGLTNWPTIYKLTNSRQSWAYFLPFRVCETKK